MAQVSIAAPTAIAADQDLLGNVSNNGAPMDYVEVIETVISSLDSGDTAMVSHLEGGRIWMFKYGSVEVYVQLTGSTDDDSLSVWSPVMKLPARNEPELMRKLLEMNWSDTFEARFAIFKSAVGSPEVVVHATRTLAEISPGEISRAITVVATIADNHDEALRAEFGGTAS